MPIVDRLWYTLGLDTRKYDKSAKGADKKTRKLAEGISKKLTGAVAGLAAAYLGTQGLRKAMEFTIAAAIKQEEIFKKLETVVNLTGISYDNAKPRIDAFLTSMQRTTRYGDTDLAPALQQITMLTGDLEKGFEGSKIAADLASSGLFDLNTASRYVAMAMAGEVTMLGRYIPQLKVSAGYINENMSATQKWAVAKGFLNEKFGGMAEKDLDTYTGQMNALQNEIGDLGELIGEKFIPYLTGIAEEAKLGATGLNALLSSATGLKNILKPEGDLLSGMKQLWLALDRAAFKGTNLQAIKLWAYFRKLGDEAELAALSGGYVSDEFKRIEDSEPFKDSVENAEEFNKEIEELKLKLLALSDPASALLGYVENYQEQLDKVNKGTKEWYELKIKLVKAEQDLVDLMDERIDKMSVLGGLRGMGIEGLEHGEIPGFGIPKPEMQEALSGWRQFWEEVVAEMSGGQDLLHGAFIGIRQYLNNFANDAIDIFQGIFSGNWLQVGYSLVSMMGSLFGDDGSAARARAQLRQLRDEVDRNIDSIDRMTDAQRQARIAELEMVVQFFEYIASTMPTTEMAAQMRANAEEYRREIEALNAAFADDAALRGVESFQDLMGYLGDPNNVDFRKGKTLIDHFADVFDMTAEQQIALYEMLLETLQNAGDLTLEQEWAIEAAIRRLREGIEEDQQQQQAQDIASQTYRSVTTITESQANVLVAVLNTIRAEVQSILDVLTGIAQSLSGGLGGAIYNVGGITFNISGSNGSEIADSVVAELRGMGMRAG